jgi:hypothetical protein
MAQTKRVPEHISTSVRKVEPVGGGMVRLYFALERNGAWDDQCTLIMPCASLPQSLGFAMESAQQIAAEIETPHTGLLS